MYRKVYKNYKRRIKLVYISRNDYRIYRFFHKFTNPSMYIEIIVYEFIQDLVNL